MNVEVVGPEFEEFPKMARLSRRVIITEKIAAGLAAAIEVGDCLEWQGKFTCKGVTPVVPWYDAANRRTENAPVPRLLWEAEHGPIPEGKLVYRSCCNTACVLHGHLICGTRADWAKARKKAGVTSHSQVTKLHLTLSARRRADVTNTIEKAREVRLLAGARLKTEEISRRTGVHPTMVAEIRQGTAWRELSGSPFAGLGA
jgi:hypothetical protein